MVIGGRGLVRLKRRSGYSLVGAAKKII